MPTPICLVVARCCRRLLKFKHFSIKKPETCYVTPIRRRHKLVQVASSRRQGWRLEEQPPLPIPPRWWLERRCHSTGQCFLHYLRNVPLEALMLECRNFRRFPPRLKSSPWRFSSSCRGNIRDCVPRSRPPWRPTSGYCHRFPKTTRLEGSPRCCSIFHLGPCLVLAASHEVRTEMNMTASWKKAFW